MGRENTAHKLHTSGGGVGGEAFPALGALDGMSQRRRACLITVTGIEHQMYAPQYLGSGAGVQILDLPLPRCTALGSFSPSALPQFPHL